MFNIGDRVVQNLYEDFPSGIIGEVVSYCDPYYEVVFNIVFKEGYDAGYKWLFEPKELILVTKPKSLKEYM